MNSEKGRGEQRQEIKVERRRKREKEKKGGGEIQKSLKKFSSPIKVLENPLRKNGGTRISVVYVIMCSILPQKARHSVEERKLLSCPNQKYRETHSRITRKME